MAAKNFTGDGSALDLRLMLQRVGNRVVSVLSRLDDPTGAGLARSEREPNWDLIANGVEILQCPDQHRGSDLAALGQELGRTAFGPKALEIIACELRSHVVRIWLNADVALARIPWESCVFEQGGGVLEGVLSMHPGLNLIREIPGVPPALRKSSGPIRVLVVWADPCSVSYPHLPGIAAEAQSVMSALATAECRRFVVEELRFATPSSLERVLRSNPPEVVHFIGHGDLRPTGGVLVLDSGEPNQEALIHDDEFAGLLAKSSVQLVVLSGCMTGDAVFGVATELGRCGIPAIIAMQAPINDLSAGQFSRAFYGSLAMGDTVDEAVIEGRHAIRGVGNDWAVPVALRSPFESPRFELEFDLDLLPEVPTRRHNLTYDDRPFIGRYAERADIRDRICLKKQRLLTITGMGGMGKTRLAKQVAAELLDDFPDGVWMVECDSLRGREQLLGAIASLLGLAATGTEVEVEIVRQLESKRLLLYLDCFEGLVDQADVTENILKHSPDCQILVTSRVVLGLPREFEYRLSPMTLKKRGVEASDGVSLFVEAASHSLNTFEVNSRNRALIRELCQLLEGVPLALVLAAGRLRHLSLTELVEQVRSNPLDVLRRRGGPKDRQSDLYRVVASSFLLLAPNESGLLDKLSLFAGAFTVEDAAEVCGRPKQEMLQGLSALRDHSLLQVQLVADRTRYKLLDTVREFLEQLPRDEAEVADRMECAKRHAELYTRAAELIGRLMAEGRWSEGTTLLWSEIANLRAACRFSVAHEDHKLSARLATGLTRTYFETALYEDLESLSNAGLAAAQALNDPRLECRLLGLTGALAAVRKDEPGWRFRWGRRLEICESIGDLENGTDALTDLAAECFELGYFDEATQYLERATGGAEAAGSLGLMACCYARWAQHALKAGDEPAVRRWLEKAALALDRGTEKDYLPAVCQGMALAYESLGDKPRALQECRKLLAMAVESDRYRLLSWSLNKLLTLYEDLGEPKLAVLFGLAAVKLYAEVSTRQGERSRSLLAQLLKRVDESFSQVLLAEKKTSWRALVRRLNSMAQ